MTDRLRFPPRPGAILLAVIACAAWLIALPSIAQASDLKVVNGWISPPITGDEASVYFAIQSRSKKTRTIVGASSERASSITVHRTAVVDGQWSSVAMPEGMTIPAGGAVAFAPRGLFLKMISNGALEEGETISIVLEFANGEKLPFDAIVKDA